MVIKYTYILTTKSGIIVITGIENRPIQNTAELKIIKYMPLITLPMGIVGQNKLKKV